ncbi:unnamed protein product [Acanthoscelides obtectus]|uniref:Uncharacterized protein n=1 Tax=Acanthoscelides obtectus TaxID=200917 RepID=A0A9P0Q6C4_ACAOB|nr:unnamed protein product [Acanthoscelides obtectus]CAK1652810.1 hypothetical protein AOBTE_LOCUS17920 [Acanthoscelides obtectus]
MPLIILIVEIRELLFFKLIVAGSTGWRIENETHAFTGGGDTNPQILNGKGSRVIPHFNFFSKKKLSCQ